MGVKRRWLTWWVAAGLAAVFVAHRVFHDLVPVLLRNVEEPGEGEPATADGVGERVAGVEEHCANGHSNVPWKAFQLVKDCSSPSGAIRWNDSQIR